MIRGKLKKVASTITILAVLSTTVLSSSAISGISKEKQKIKGKKVHQATGLKEPTKEDLEWMKENMVQVKKVLPNELGLQRANEVRKKKGFKKLGKDKVVQKGQEVIPMSPQPSSTTKNMSTLNTAAYSDFLPVADTEALSSTTLPTYVDNSALPYFPPIRSQDSIGSCVSFACTYYQATYMTAMVRGWNVKDNNDNSNKFSPKWTYNLVNGGVDNGSTPQQSYRIMLENGIATWDKFPYNGDESVSKNYLEWSTDEDVWTDALNYKIDKAGYVKIADGTDTPVTSPASPTLNNIKQLLNNGYILTYSTKINSWGWTTIKDNPSTDADNEFVDKDVVYIQGPSGIGHMMTVVGYNDDIWVDINNNNIVDPGENGAFRIANSHGDDWRDNGFAWIAYDALNKVSAVNGVPATQNRESIWGRENLAYWITAKTSYTPDLIGKITLNHAKRNQVKLELGIQEVDGTNTVSFSPHAVNDSGSTECDFDGPEAASGDTEVIHDATFVFDFSDMLKGKDLSGITKNWTIKVTDTILDGSSALVKNFSVIDSLGNTSSCSQVNQTVDGTSILFSSPLTLASNNPTESEWVFKNSMPFGMMIEKSYQFGDKIYAVGYSPDKDSNGLICYDPLSDQVSWIRSIGNYNWNLSVGYDNKIYLFDDSNVKVYDINTGVISSKSALPSRKFSVAIVELNGKMYIINGLLSDSYGTFLSKGVTVYNPATDTWSSTADTNIARYSPGAAVSNGKIYLFGGYDSEWNLHQSFEEYDTATNQWTLIDNCLPCPVSSKYLSLGNKIYAFGRDQLNQVFEYNPDLSQWKKHSPIPEPYDEFVAESVNGKTYVMGGKMTYSDSVSKNVLEFTPSVCEEVLTPEFSIQGGTYTSVQSINLSCETEGATIRYTTDGSIPTATSEIYSDPITVAGSKIIKAYAQKAGLADSNVSVSSYLISIQVGDVNGDGIVDAFDYPLLLGYVNGTTTDFPVEDDLWAGDLDGDGLINNTDVSLMLQKIHGEISFFPKEEVKAPTLSLAEGTYTSFQSIKLSCGTKGAIIRYTTDGSIPTSDSKIYTGCFDITKSATIKAIAQKVGLPDSDITSATYTLSIKIGDVNGDGIIDSFDYLLFLDYTNGKIDDFPVEDDLWIGDLDGDGLINNTDRSLMHQKIFGNITFFPKEQVKAPSFSVGGGSYTSIQTVTLNCTTEGATIRYTLDGTTPSSTSPVYTDPITVASSKTIKACAEKDNMITSAITILEYELTIRVGDVNGDGNVDALDYALLKMYLQNPSYDFPVDDDMWAGDLNGDNSIDALDFFLMKQFIDGQITCFPKE